MPQGAVRRKPNGQLDGRRPGAVTRRASTDHRNGRRTPVERSRVQEALAWLRDYRDQRNRERQRQGPPRYPRKPKTRPGHFNTRRVRYNWGQARKSARQARHARKGRRSGKWWRAIGFGAAAGGELALILGFRTTGAALGLGAAGLGAVAAALLAQTNGSTSKSRSPGRQRR